MKFLLNILLVLFTFTSINAVAQDEMFKQKPERKKIWRKWRKNREAYNPYLQKKAKNKPSARMAKGDRRYLEKQKRRDRRFMRRSGRRVKKSS